MTAARFFVSMLRDSRVAYLAGPFVTHDEALAMVEPARKLACKLDGRAHFDSFGTLRTELPRVGALNSRLGVVPCE